MPSKWRIHNNCSRPKEHMYQDTMRPTHLSANGFRLSRMLVDAAPLSAPRGWQGGGGSRRLQAPSGSTLWTPCAPLAYPMQRPNASCPCALASCTRRALASVWQAPGCFKLRGVGAAVPDSPISHVPRVNAFPFRFHTCVNVRAVTVAPSPRVEPFEAECVR